MPCGFTGNCSPDELERYVSIGFDDALPKPFTTAQLRTGLQRALLAENNAL